MNLKDKACLITGGTRGIGAAAAIALAEQGANLVINGRRIDDAAKEVVKQIEAMGRKCYVVSADIAKPEEAAHCVTETVARLGTIDLLIHSAGGPANGGLLDLTPEAWHAAFDVHIHPIFHLCRAAIPVMKKKRDGSIVLISSTAGVRGIKTNVAYQTVKGAIPSSPALGVRIRRRQHPHQLRRPRRHPHRFPRENDPGNQETQPRQPHPASPRRNAAASGDSNSRSGDE